MADYTILVSTVLMIGALLIGKKLIFGSPDGGDSRVERIARAMLALGLGTSASLPSASGSSWQAWTAVSFMVTSAILWLIVVIQKRRTGLTNDRAGR